MKLKAVIPVLAPYRVSDDAEQHIARAPLCGIDFFSLTGKTWLMSMLDGKIEYVHDTYTPAMPGDYDSLGRFIVVRSVIAGVTVWARYCHNEVFAVYKGKDVCAGELIGNYGSTGVSTGPHSHVDFWVNRSALADAVALGMADAEKYDRNPWPNSAVLTNVDPTAMLKKAGLDVINSQKEKKA